MEKSSNNSSEGLNVKVTQDPALLHVGVYPMYVYTKVVFTAALFVRVKTRNNRISINWIMDKQNVTCPCNRKSFNNKMKLRTKLLINGLLTYAATRISNQKDHVLHCSIYSKAPE